MKFLTSTIIFASLVLLASCNTDDLCYHHPHDGQLYIQFDWRYAPDAHPSGMCVWFYHESGTEGIPRDMSTEGGTTYLFPGNFHIVAHNNDTEWITWQDPTYHHTYICTTRSASVLEPMLDGFARGARNDELIPIPDERVAVTPEPVWSAFETDCAVSVGNTIVMYPRPLHCHYTIEFRNVNTLKHITGMCAAITGMSDGVTLIDGEKTRTTCTMTFAVTPQADGHTIKGSFYTFGHHPEVDTPHKIALYLAMDDGKKYKYVNGDYLDATQQVHDAPNPREVHIVIDGLQVPEVISNGTGFDVGVGDWEDQHIDIQI